ncbi:pyridoxine 5'-phosphate synthase [Candidatus Endowatersipora endosymbiont of Watersipora subatra]|uniref:pyridoxine 5'-phosphate synthase n=1 Tax=Candidatus Endowatersipora endosymbiont of Watersipora subatra TaxID=3077946 RepID=UPI00312CADF0
MSVALSVNLNAVAQLRNRRNLPWPSVIGMGRVALNSGAQGITIHPRPDQRHIRFSDVGELLALIDNEFPDRELNIEGYPSDDFVLLCEKHRPKQVTLVPDDPVQTTSDHGWDFRVSYKKLSPIVARLKGGGMRISLFTDPNPEVIKWVTQTGCNRIELYTGPYGATYLDPEQSKEELERLVQTADTAQSRGIDVNAGHDLTIQNLSALLARIPYLAEVSIGHALTADALEYGMAQTVKRFLKVCSGDRIQT